jgi:hypothetical protein
MPSGSSVDYGSWAKRGTLIGVAMFLLGAVGTAAAGPAGLPAWSGTVFTDMLGFGIVVVLVSVFVVGITLPLVKG